MNPFIFLAATFFGAGKLPKAPGTWGSLAAIIVAVVGLHFTGWEIFYGLTLLVFLIGIPVADKYGKATGKADDPEIVIDEVAGQWIALFPLPYLTDFSDRIGPSIATLAAFVLFRFFDILKPWPIKAFEQNFKGGFGVMIDDVAAGVMAALVLVVIGYFL